MHTTSRGCRQLAHQTLRCLPFLITHKVDVLTSHLRYACWQHGEGNRLDTTDVLDTIQCWWPQAVSKNADGSRRGFQATRYAPSISLINTIHTIYGIMPISRATLSFHSHVLGTVLRVTPERLRTALDVARFRPDTPL